MSSNVQVMDDAPNGALSEIMRTIDRGDFHLDVEENLKKLVEEIQNTGNGGKIAIEISIKPDKHADIVKISGRCKLSLPARPVRESVFFLSSDGMLSRTDQKQVDMFPRKRSGESHD